VNERYKNYAWITSTSELKPNTTCTGGEYSMHYDRPSGLYQESYVLNSEDESIFLDSLVFQKSDIYMTTVFW